jgi:hypothetical protein
MFLDICDGLKVGGFLSPFKFSSLLGLSFFVFLVVDYQHSPRCTKFLHVLRRDDRALKPSNKGSPSPIQTAYSMIAGFPATSKKDEAMQLFQPSGSSKTRVLGHEP